MVDISRKTYERNGAETIVDGVLWLNEKQTQEGLDHKTFRMTTLKYLLSSRKQRNTST